MRKLSLFILLATFSCFTFGQKKTQIIEKGINNVKTYEQRLSKGLEKKYIIKEESYNEQGKLIELRKIKRKGENKKWEKYKYDKNGKLIEETHLDEKGKVKKRIVTKYRNDLIIERDFYNSDDKIYKKKTYEYQFN
ncbi:MAG: hypothetical protein U9R19_03710 [Bacteroidota bacterium]|nr:hypothetical protein [Bacteroidota bacterium]